MRLRERLRRRAVAAADVANRLAWGEIEPLGDHVDQGGGGILGLSIPVRQ